MSTGIEEVRLCLLGQAAECFLRIEQREDSLETLDVIIASRYYIGRDQDLPVH
jgi:hypothetical protein